MPVENPVSDQVKRSPSIGAQNQHTRQTLDAKEKNRKPSLEVYETSFSKQIKNPLETYTKGLYKQAKIAAQ